MFGATLVAAGIAAWIVAARHVPGRTVVSTYCIEPCATKATGWSSTAYDLVRIGAWALLIFGAVTVALALVREYRRMA